MRPDRHARPEYLAAFREIVERIARSLEGAPKRSLPVQMYVAGGAALHAHTGERVSKDIDASFSRRIALPDDLEVAYRDADGAARLLYLDRQYSDTLALMHEDAHEDAITLTLPGLGRTEIEVRVLSPVDLAVSKLARFSSQDREDIATLARHGHIDSKSLRRRAEQAIVAYVGNTDGVRTSIDMACRIVADVEKRRAKPGPTRTRPG
jgi:hypothetical protein